MASAAFLGIHDPRLSAAVISGLTAILVVVLTLPLREWLRLTIDSKLYERKGDVDYLLEQRKALSALIGAHHGRLIDAADRFCHRAVRIEKHAGDNWLDPARPPTGGYFFDSTIYRFLVVAGAAESLERRGLVIDQRVGRPEDQKLIWFARAFRWSLTAAELFEGSEYDPERATDHFFTDMFRDLCRGFDGGELDPGFGVMRGRIRADALYEPVRRFFTDIKPGELRWDRLMASRIILMALLNEYGDAVQQSSQDWFDRAASSIHDDHVAGNLAAWLPRFRLDSAPMNAALEKRCSSTASEN